MKTLRIILPAIVVIAAVIAAVRWGHMGSVAPSTAVLTPASKPVNSLRLALVPEYDVFALRKSYQDMGQLLAKRLGRPVEIVTLNTYEAVLLDFREKQIDGAFLGSLVAVLAMDQFGAKVLVKPEQSDGVSMYRGVIFVRDDSPIRSLDEIHDKSIAMLRATTAGCLFALGQMSKRGWNEDLTPVKIVWAGTHDEVIHGVMNQKVDVGTVKNLRLEAYLRANPDQKVRQLAVSPAVPNNALVVTADVAQAIGPRLSQILLTMDGDVEGKHALEHLGAARFIPCSAQEYRPVYDMIDAVASQWQKIGAPGAPPVRPATRPVK